MPIYEYECQGCGIRFERRQSFHDEPIKECPECKGRARRVLHPVGIIFKGSGFYITDSRNSGTASVGAKEASSNGDNGSSGASEPKSPSSEAKSEKSETKSEAKSKAKSEAKSEAKAGAAKSSE